jgi:hypothetical protein
MMLKGEAICVVLNHIFYADCSVGTTVRLSGAAIPPHLFSEQFGGRNRSSFLHRLPIPQVSQSSGWAARAKLKHWLSLMLPARCGTGFELFELIVGLSS